MILPSFERVLKAEIYSIKLEKGTKNRQGSKSLLKRIQRGSSAIGANIGQIHHTDRAIHNWRKELAEHAEEPHKKWITDIMPITTKQGWLYLAVILDPYSRIVSRLVYVR